jgi:hypothetical protein
MIPATLSLLEPTEAAFVKLVEDHAATLGAIKGYLPGLLKVLDLAASRASAKLEAAVTTIATLRGELETLYAALEVAKAPPSEPEKAS